MPPDNWKNERLRALAIAGALALNYPLLFLFGDGVLVYGIPVLYLYLFLAWGVFIFLCAAIMNHHVANRDSDSDITSDHNSKRDT